MEKRIELKNEKVFLDGVESFLYDEEFVYNLVGDTLFTAQEFCDKFGYDNTCKMCDDTGEVVIEELKCINQSNECCGSCWEPVLTTCYCEGQIFNFQTRQNKN